jgi:hypothetical protein
VTSDTSKADVDIGVDHDAIRWDRVRRLAEMLGHQLDRLVAPGGRL